MTKFKLLVQTKDTAEASGLWKEWREEEAHSAEAAIRQAYMRGDTQDVLAVVAIPSRSWRPQQVRVETTQRVVFGAEKPSQDAA